MKDNLTSPVFAPLTRTERQQLEPWRKHASSKLKAIFPAPTHSEKHQLPRHSTHGEPTSIYTYRNANEAVCFHALRFDYRDTDGSNCKVVLPVTWCTDSDGQGRWSFKGPGPGRPPFNEDCIARSPEEKWVIFCEGEKAAQAAAILFPDWVATTTLGGCKSAHQTNFSVFAGRTVVVSPDHDEPGHAYGREVARRVLAAGAAKVLHLPAELLGSRTVDGDHVVDGAAPKAGWDLADAIEQGWTAPTVANFFANSTPLQPFALAANDNNVVHQDDAHTEFVTDRRWLYRRVSVDGEIQKVPVCSPLHILGWARDEHGEQWSLRVMLVDPDGHEHEVFVPSSHLGDDGNAVRRALMDRGLRLASLKTSRTNLSHYLQSAEPTNRYRSVSTLGWYNDVFVLPDRVLGSSSENILFRPASATKHAFHSAGSLDSWKCLAELAQGNSRLTLALSAAFAAPLLRHTGDETGGFHFRGKSSTGKSTTMVLASTVWGGNFSSYIVQWRATSNGLEGIASSHSDMLLCLDELSQAAPRTLGETMYMLGNGMGKVRADQSGAARATKTWRLMFLSTGEESFEDKMREAGTGQRLKAGQEVRVVDIPADAGSGHGIFETVHKANGGGELSRQIKELAAKAYGHAGPAFVECVAKDVELARQEVQRVQRSFVKNVLPQDADGQVARVAERFGLVAGAGELAIANGILPLKEGSAIWSCEICFRDWLLERGGAGASEDRRSVEAVVGFITRHGASRFDRWGEIGMHDVASDTARDRLGWKKQEQGRWDYFLTPDGFREACLGYDPKMTAKVLAEKGILKTAGDGKSSKVITVPGHTKMRLYHVVLPVAD